MDHEEFEKEMASLEAEIKEREAHLGNLRGTPDPSAMTPQQYARYARSKDELERIEAQIAKIEGDCYPDGTPPEDDGDDK